MQNKKAILWFLLALGIVLIDQVLKFFAILRLLPGPLFTLTKNTGATFGLFPGANVTMVVISILAALVVIWFIPKHTKWEAGALSILLGGIVGNGIDRVLRGGVIDYIKLGSFPIFNFADMCIVSGIILLIFLELQNSSNSSSSSK